MVIAQAGDYSWVGVKKRRVHRQYETKQGMLDDIWLAHEHGWLPVAMTELRQGGLLGKLRREKPIYLVAYLRRAP